MDEVCRVSDRWGREIVLTQSRWSTHIEAGHSELRGQSDILADTLTAPTLVNRDKSHPHREVFYRESPLPYPLDRLLVKVVVEFGATGWVVTAHLVKHPHRKEQRIWP